jgi:hypothetical protein
MVQMHRARAWLEVTNAKASLVFVGGGSSFGRLLVAGCGSAVGGWRSVFTGGAAAGAGRSGEARSQGGAGGGEGAQLGAAAPATRRLQGRAQGRREGHPFAPRHPVRQRHCHPHAREGLAAGDGSRFTARSRVAVGPGGAGRRSGGAAGAAGYQRRGERSPHLHGGSDGANHPGLVRADQRAAPRARRGGQLRGP